MGSSGEKGKRSNEEVPYLMWSAGGAHKTGVFRETMKKFILPNIICMNTDNICYTGIGSVKSGNHTKKKYLDIMDKHFREKCSVYTKSLKCKSCKKSTEMHTKEMMKQLHAKLKRKTYKLTTKKEEELVKQSGKCKRCKNKNTKKCNFDNYLRFSGAELGKC